MSNARVTWLAEDDPPEYFPPVSCALREPDGLLAAGGDLHPDRLLYAYRHGIFPWYDDGQPILWWSPDPRCVFGRGDFKIAKRFARSVRQSTYRIRINSAFSEVIRACAGPRRSEQGTWISTDMMAAYERLHDDGWAHSIEVWSGSALVGGLYGVGIGTVFFGESMFSLASNASKMSMLYLDNLLQSGRIQMLDCQVVSGHLLRLGSQVMPRQDFAARLEILTNPCVRLENWPDAPIECSRLLTE